MTRKFDCRECAPPCTLTIEDDDTGVPVPVYCPWVSGKTPGWKDVDE